MYIKLSKDLSAKTYQDNKERLEEKSVKDIKVFLKKKKKKKGTMWPCMIQKSIRRRKTNAGLV